MKVMWGVRRYDRGDSIQAFEPIWNLTQEELTVQLIDRPQKAVPECS